MPPKDRHGKTAQDYRAALIAELDAVPHYRRRRKAQRSPLLFVWLLVPVALLWPRVQRWLHSTPIAEPPFAVAESQTPAALPAFAASAPSHTAPQPLGACLKHGNVVDKEVLRCRYGAMPRAHELVYALKKKTPPLYLTKYKPEQELTPVRTCSLSSTTKFIGLLKKHLILIENTEQAYTRKNMKLKNTSFLNSKTNLKIGHCMTDSKIAPRPYYIHTL